MAMDTIAVIHVAKAQLGLDEGTYRALLLRVTGKSSTKDMTERQRIAVVDELKRMGFQVRRGAGKPLPASTKAYIRLIHKLWSKLYDKGIVRDGSRKALRAFCGRHLPAGVSTDPDFLTWEQASPVIEALKAMERRGKPVEG